MKVNRARTLLLVVFLAISLHFVLRPEIVRAQPNIIFIMADDLGYGELGSYGQELIRTPHLDRMAHEGMRFTQFYSASTVCAPAREALMLGLHTGHSRHQNREHPMRPEYVTVAETLRSHGYATAMIGKWGLGTLGSGGEPSVHGFDFWFGYLGHKEAHRHYPTHLWRNGEQVVYPQNKESHGKYYSGNVMMDEAEKFIRRNQNGPFFLYLPLTLPHADIVVPEQLLSEYAGRFPEKPFPGYHYSAQPMPNAATAAMITLLDSYAGRLMALLAELEIDEQTVVFFTSDNGPVSVGGRDFEFFDGAGPLRGGKRDLYEGGIRVPMIVRWPGRVPQDQVRDDIWTLTDVKATLSEIAGSVPGDSDGVSVLPTLLGKYQDISRRAFYWAWEGRTLNGPVGLPSSWGEPVFIQAARLGDWKAVRFNRSDHIELYNLRQDISELHDVSSRFPSVKEELQQIMDQEHAPL